MNFIINKIKQFPVISGILTLVITLKITNIDIQNFLSNYISYEASLMFRNFFLQTICAFACILLLKKLKLSKSYNIFLNASYNKKSLILYSLGISSFLIINLVTNFDPIIFKTSKINLLLYFLSFMSTGLFEESLFRGLIFNNMNNKYGSTRNGFIFSLIVTNLIFGIGHIVWLFMGISPLLNSLTQIYYAFVLGLFFNAIYIKFNSLTVPIIFHGLIDVFGSINYLHITSRDLFEATLVQSPLPIGEFVFTIVYFIPFLIAAIYILKSVVPSKNSTHTPVQLKRI